MACDSLELLRAAVPTGFPQEILDERIWGSIIGMFELNNLAMQVQSPLELYFLACADLPELQRTGVLSQTSAWLDALDKDYDMCVEVRYCYMHMLSLSFALKVMICVQYGCKFTRVFSNMCMPSALRTCG